MPEKASAHPETAMLPTTTELFTGVSKLPKGRETFCGITAVTTSLGLLISRLEFSSWASVLVLTLK